MSGSMFGIGGSIALVTGSSRGIGLGLAGALAAAGARVVLNGRDAARVDAAAASLSEAYGPAVSGSVFDVTDSAAVAIAVRRIEDEIGPIDILVNNAGLQRRAPIVDFTDEQWDQIIATNLTSAFLVSRAVAASMMARRRGRIVNICSLQSRLARPGIAAYSASKGALLMLTRGMCADLAGYGIGVNAIGPGYFETELTSALVADEEFSRWVRERTPAGRWGRIEDLYGTLIYLVSPASAFVNGQIVYVDGGMSSVL